MDTTAHRVQPGSFLTLHYRLSGPRGDVVDTFGGPPATLTLGKGELPPAVEQRLLGLAEGTRATFELPAGDAFGERNPGLLQWVSRKLLQREGEPGDDYEVGEVVQFATPDGQGRYAGAVVESRAGDEGAVLLDFNHPLAGQAVTFEVHVVGVL